MGTTTEKLNYLIATKNAIKEAINSMGVTVGDNVPFRDYASLILQIPSGVDTSDATAVASDLMLNKTAYSKGDKITGTFDVMTSEIAEIGGTLTDVDELADEIMGE